jgi:hypothetical protein
MVDKGFFMVLKIAVNPTQFSKRRVHRDDS